MSIISGLYLAGELDTLAKEESDLESLAVQTLLPVNDVAHVDIYVVCTSVNARVCKFYFWQPFLWAVARADGGASPPPRNVFDIRRRWFVRERPNLVAIRGCTPS